MRDLKYIIVIVGVHEVAILFNGLLTHVDMIPKNTKIVSAGFCDLTFGRFMEVKANIHETKAASLPSYPPRIMEDFKVISNTLNRTMLI